MTSQKSIEMSLRAAMMAKEILALVGTQDETLWRLSLRSTHDSLNEMLKALDSPGTKAGKE